MAFRTLMGLMVFFFVSIDTWAEEIQINPTHPDQYTVVKGDTLWDISGKFLNHPWQWPELWGSNSQIKNPHLVYPGDTIYFSIVNENHNLTWPEMINKRIPQLIPPAFLVRKRLKMAEPTLLFPKMES